MTVVRARDVPVDSKQPHLFEDHETAIKQSASSRLVAVSARVLARRITVATPSRP